MNKKQQTGQGHKAKVDAEIQLELFHEAWVRRRFCLSSFIW